MVKYWVFMEGQRKFIDAFEKQLTSREYGTRLPNFPTNNNKITMNEIRLYDISLFEAAVPQLMWELKPVGNIDNFMPKWMRYLTRFARWCVGLKNPPNRKVVESKGNVSTYIVAYKDDAWINGVEQI